MTVLKVPSTLVSTGSRLSYPRLDGYEGWLEASELLGRLDTGPLLCKVISIEKTGSDGSDRFLLSITTNLL